MRLRDSRLSRVLSGSAVSVLAGAVVLACSAAPSAPADSTDQTSQASTRSQGIFHSHVTHDSWQRHAGQHRGPWDDEKRCHPRALDFCPMLDEDFIGVDAGAACEHVTTTACPDRVDTWDNAIVFDFAIAITNDCRFGEWSTGLLSDSDVTNYLNDLLGFTLQLLGCPLDGTDTPLTFGLIPAALEGDKFTSADLDALVDTYSAAVAQALSDNGSPPLTAAQAQALDTKLQRLANRVPRTSHSGKFTFSTCDAATMGSTLPADDDNDNDCH